MRTLLPLGARSLWSRRVTAALCVFAIAMSVALLLGVQKIRSDARESFASTISGTDLIVGARGGPLNLLLYSVFHLGDATTAVSWDSFELVRRHPDVAWALPISLGDSHRGFRVMGTSRDYFEHFRYGRRQPLAFRAGGPFTDLHDAVLGSEVAASLGHALGDGIEVAHGLGEPSKLKKETITGVNDLALPEEVPEHTPYRSMDMAEKYVTIKNTKYGRIIELTEELVFFDQTGQVLNRARLVGEGSAYYQEKLIVEGVQDLTTTVYYPSDTATAVYSTTNGNLKTSNALSSSGLEEILKLAHNMTSDSPATKYIMINIIGQPLLVPVDLMTEAWELANSAAHPKTSRTCR